MNYKQHRAKWDACTGCSLCTNRRRVVLYRGDLPADVLFIGEAPGTSEDDLGQPFVGPAGQLLNRIITNAMFGRKVRLGFTNLVACIPLGDDGKKAVEPPADAIAACSTRLHECFSLANPKGLVFVGKLPSSVLGAIKPYSEGLSTTITHPAAILRAEKQNQGLMIQNCIVSIADLFDELDL